MPAEPTTYIIPLGTEDRLSVLRVDNVVYVHSNDRVLGFDPTTAQNLAKALWAVTSGAFVRAVTESHLQLEAARTERAAASQRSRSDSAPQIPPRPTLENL